MKATEVIRTIMKSAGVKQTNMAYRLNISKNALNMRLGQDNVSVGKMNEMLRVVDYRLVAVPSSARLQDGWYEVE